MRHGGGGGACYRGADVWWWDTDTERTGAVLEVAKGWWAGGVPERARVSTWSQADAIDKGKCRYRIQWRMRDLE
jgi:hypothetical protein